MYFWSDAYHAVLFSLAMELCPTIDEAVALTGMSEPHVRGIVEELQAVGLLEDTSTLTLTSKGRKLVEDAANADIMGGGT